VFFGKTPAEADRAFRQRLGGKYVAALAGDAADVVWKFPAKLREGLGGSDGHLSLTRDSLVYETTKRGASRTWPIELIDSVSSAGPWELTVYPLERAGWTRGPREFRFQLKTPLPEPQYQALWRAVNAKHMTIYPTKKDTDK
jgi:hypothetical protein